jgi:hypothetical protein
MSKIQINELNNNSELEVLNAQETTEVVGGYYYGYGSYSDKFASVFQNNYNETNQAALSYYGDASNSNTTNQNNSANIYQ